MARKKKYSTNGQEVKNAVKTLISNIRFQSVDKPLRTIVLTSAVPNEGKSTLSVMLAQSLAEAGNRVLLVECDMRRRSLGPIMDVHGQAGVFAVASGQVPLRQAVVATGTPNLFFLDAEPGIPNPPDLIASVRFRRMVEDMRKEYKYIIFDTPAVGTFIDGAVLSNIADGTVLVVRLGQTKRTDLSDAYQQLQNAGANVIGACTTFVEGSSSEYYYAYYNSQGKRVHKGESHDTDDAMKAWVDPQQVYDTMQVGQGEQTNQRRQQQAGGYVPASSNGGASGNNSNNNGRNNNGNRNNNGGVTMPKQRGRR